MMLSAVRAVRSLRGPLTAATRTPRYLPRASYADQKQRIQPPAPAPNNSLHEQLPHWPEMPSEKRKKKSVRRAGGHDIAIGDNSLLTPEDQLKLADRIIWKAAAISVADEFDLGRVQALLVATPGFTVEKELSDEVLHLRTEASDDGGGELFVFRDGSIVSWAPTSSLARRIAALILADTNCSRSAKDKAKTVAYGNAEIDEKQKEEEMDFAEADDLNTSVVGDTILIGSDAPSSALSKLAFSHALARSAKVSVLEARLDRYLDSMRHVPHLLASGKSLSLSRTEILRKVGVLLSLRAALNLSGNVESLLDTPEYYWSRPQLGEYFTRASHWLDIEPRIAVLNRKMDYATECVEVLRGDSSERHSLKLEWFIIILIAVEVCFEFLHYFERHETISAITAATTTTPSHPKTQSIAPQVLAPAPTASA